MLAACVLLSGLAAATPDKPRLVILELVGSRDVEPAVAKALTEALTAAAGRTGLFQVTSQAEVANLLGLERQRELLGCAESSSSCTAELAGALGAQFLMSGSVTKLGQDAFQLSLQVQDTARAMTLGRASRIASDLASLRALVPVAFAEASATPPPPSPSREVVTHQRHRDDGCGGLAHPAQHGRLCACRAVESSTRKTPGAVSPRQRRSEVGWPPGRR